MMNGVKADLYRLFRLRGFWIVTLIHMLIIQGNIFFSASEVKLNAVQQLASSSTNFMIVEAFVVVILTMLLGTDLSNKLYKNSITSGQSRLSFFFEKNIVMIVASLMQFIIYYGLTFVETAVFNGIGDVPSDFGSMFIKTLAVQFLASLVWVSICSFMLYLLHSNTAAIVVFFVGLVGLPLLPTLLPKITWLQYLSFNAPLGSDNSIILKTAVAAVVTIVIFSTLSAVTFKKDDL